MPKLNARKFADVAAVIKTVREDKCITQSDLASRLAFSRDYLVDLEAGKPNIFATRLFGVLHELGIVMTLEFEESHAES